MREPANIKKGIAKIVKEFTAEYIFCTICIIETSLTINPISVASAMAIEIGKPNSKKAINPPKRIIEIVTLPHLPPCAYF
jgi:hypothetical protein